MAPHAPVDPLISDDATSPSLAAVISPDHVAPPAPGPLTDQALWSLVVRSARCANGDLDPDEWFPVSEPAGAARQEAAAAIAVCTACLVRCECLVLSLRHWDIGQHGVWGGLVPADRARLRRRLAAPHRAPGGMAAVGGGVTGGISQVLRRLVKGGDGR